MMKRGVIIDLYEDIYLAKFRFDKRVQELHKIIRIMQIFCLRYLTYGA